MALLERWLLLQEAVRPAGLSEVSRYRCQLLLRLADRPLGASVAPVALPLPLAFEVAQQLRSLPLFTVGLLAVLPLLLTLLFNERYRLLLAAEVGPDHVLVPFARPAWP